MLSLLLAFALFLLVCLTLRSMAKPRSLFSVYFRLLLNHLHLLMLLASFRFDWPPAVAAFLSFFEAVADAPQELLSLDCLLAQLAPSASGFSRFYARLLAFVVVLPLLTIGAVLAVWACLWRRAARRGRRLPFCSRCTASFLVLAFLLHPSLSRSLFALFK